MSVLEGLLLVDKPVGPTSHDVVERIRRLSGQRRVGHAGTLDPPASGLLPLVLGRATRLVRFLPHAPKVYRGRLRLGLVTSTDDVTGEVLESAAGPLPAAEEVLEAARGLRGSLLQTPPAVSARKVGGQRLYRLARRGVRVEVEPRAVEISRFDLAPTESATDWSFEAEVSAGTYIRSLARDLGATLGCGATLLELRRTAIGPMRVDEALAAPSLGEISAEALRAALVPLERIPLVPPAVRLTTAADVAGFRRGSFVRIASSLSAGYYRVTDSEGSLLGVAETAGDRLRPRVVLPEADDR